MDNKHEVCDFGRLSLNVGCNLLLVFHSMGLNSILFKNSYAKLIDLQKSLYCRMADHKKDFLYYYQLKLDRWIYPYVS